MLRPGLAATNDNNPPVPTGLRRTVDRVDEEIIELWEGGKFGRLIGT